jgi:hypothetical protein
MRDSKTRWNGLITAMAERDLISDKIKEFCVPTTKRQIMHDHEIFAPDQ